jgi:hypothetical protein
METKIQMDLKGADYNETLVTATQKVSISNYLSSRHIVIDLQIKAKPTWYISQKYIVETLEQQ